MQELLLLRHGKSDWSVPVRDFARPLKKRGRRGARLIGQWIAAQGIYPDSVLTSPAERASETAYGCVEAMGLPSSMIQSHRQLYLADCQALLDTLSLNRAGGRRVLLVGHNPGFEELLSHLASPKPAPRDDGKLMTTACLAHLRFHSHTGTLQPRSAELLSLVRARDLEKSDDDD